MGQTIDRVEGELVDANETSVRVKVTRTVTLQGSTAVWSGEEVVVPREGIRGFQLQRFSRGRTTMLVIGVVVGLAVLGGAISLLVGGSGRPGDGSGCTVNCQPQ